MAKLKAPLLSFGASGQIAKTVVYFPWKGLNVARKHVIPANPNSSGQLDQRGYVREAVAKIHAALIRATHPINDDDKSAYSLYAGNMPTPRTWFNQAVKNFVDCDVAGNKGAIFSDGTVVNAAHDHANFILYLTEETGATMVNGKFYLGSSKTALIKIKAGVVIAHTSVSNAAAEFDDLVAGVTYYWQFRADAADPCEGAMSGIYHFIAT